MNELPNPSLHWAVMACATFLPALVRGLHNDISWLPTSASKWRLTIIGLLTILATASENASNGGSFGALLIAAAMSGGPSVLIEILHIVNGKVEGAPILAVDEPPKP